MTQTIADAAALEGPRGALTPSPYRVIARKPEVADVVTLTLESLDGVPRPFRHGQFHMLTSYGVGEVAISISSSATPSAVVEHAIRDVGAVTHALCTAPVGTTVGVRGPFGTDWGVEELDDDADVVVVAGGIGLAPLRGAVEELVARREGTGAGKVVVLVGARSPDQILFAEALDAWRRSGAEVEVTVDLGTAGWAGSIGVVTALVATARFDPSRAVALTCGPEIMMRLAARSLADAGVDPAHILVSLERNMQCGVGWCGHCQLGPLLLCRDGPVVRYGGLADTLFMERNR